MTISCQNVTVVTSANIVAQSITVTPSDSPCIEGSCHVDVSVTWINNGGASGTLTANISIDGTPSLYPYGPESLGAGLTSTKTFVVNDLTSAGSPHTICPFPNT